MHQQRDAVALGDAAALIEEQRRPVDAVVQFRIGIAAVGQKVVDRGRVRLGLGVLRDPVKSHQAHG